MLISYLINLTSCIISSSASSIQIPDQIQVKSPAVGLECYAPLLPVPLAISPFFLIFSIIFMVFVLKLGNDPIYKHCAIAQSLAADPSGRGRSAAKKELTPEIKAPLRRVAKGLVVLDLHVPHVPAPPITSSLGHRLDSPSIPPYSSSILFLLTKDHHAKEVKVFHQPTTARCNVSPTATAPGWKCGLPVGIHKNRNGSFLSIGMGRKKPFDSHPRLSYMSYNLCLISICA